MMGLVIAALVAAQLQNQGLSVSNDAFAEARVERIGRTSRGAWRVELVLPDGRRIPAGVGAEAIVTLAPDVDADAVFVAERLVPVRALLPSRRMWLVRDAAGSDGVALASRLARRPGVAQVMPDYAFHRERYAVPVPPDDPRYGGQWYFDVIHLEDAWRRTTGTPDTGIVVIDNGCDATHPDLAPKLLGGLDVIDGDTDSAPGGTDASANHGTACAGIVGAATNNGLGIAGACPECSVRCVRMLPDDNEPVPVSADVDAMRFALDHPEVAVVSNSWGFKPPIPVPTALATAIEAVSTEARGGRGAVVVFAVGNENRALGDDELYRLPGVLAVGAINNFDEAAPFSNHGADVDLVAPTGTLTLDLVGAAGASPDDYTSLFGGTSSACPVVAGITGLLASAAPDATAAELIEALVVSTRRAPFATPDERGHDVLYGRGIVDPAAALGVLLGPVASPDGGIVPDAGGVAEEGGGADASGCGCTGVPSSPLVLVGLVARRRRTSAR